MKSNATTRSIAGAILAGGKSRRMKGFPKGILQVRNDLSIVEHLVRQIVCSGIQEIVLVANDRDAYERLGLRIIRDKRVGFGPLAGVEAALAHFTGHYEAVLCLPCDMPALSSREISVLVEAFSTTPAPVAFAKTDEGRIHPLCAVVACGLLTQVSAAIDTGALCVDGLWQQLGGHGVCFSSSDAFCNLNTLDDFSQWQRGRSTWVEV